MLFCQPALQCLDVLAEREDQMASSKMTALLALAVSSAGAALVKPMQRKAEEAVN